MIDDELVLRVERLRDSLDLFRSELRRRYKKKTAQVSASAPRTTSAQLAERWLVEVGSRDDVKAVVGEEALADLNVEFQRLLTYSERTTPRQKYDAALAGILADFRSDVIVPLKNHRGTVGPPAIAPQERDSLLGSAFIGQSFAEGDKKVNDVVMHFLTAYGLKVSTGEKPSANTVSAKVKARIDESDIFVGIFTRRDKLSGKKEWSPSPWVIDEKAYALAKGKRLILLKEAGVNSVGGLQGDYEYLEFERIHIGDLLVKLLHVLRALPIV